MIVAALSIVAGLAGMAPHSAATAQETPDPGYGYYYPTPPTTPPPDTYPPMTYPPATYPPYTYPPGTPLTSPPPVTPLVSPPPVTTPPSGNSLPETGTRGMTVAGAGLVLIGIGILAWVFAGRRRIRV